MPNNPKYIRNLDPNEASIDLFDDIGLEGISGQDFANEIKMLNSFGVTDIHVNINSRGGSVIEGFSIFSAMQNSDATIHVHIVGVAASMAGIIALAGDTIDIVDFGTIMIHAPSGSDSPDPEEQKGIDAMNSALRVILLKRTGSSAAEVDALMVGDNYLDAKQAKSAGFVDEIISSKHRKKDKERMALGNIAAMLDKSNPQDDGILKKWMAKITIAIEELKGNKNIPKTTDKITDMKQLAILLGLSAEASEQAIVDSVQKLMNDSETSASDLVTAKSDLKTANETIETQKTKLTEFEASVKKVEDAQVESEIDRAIEDGKFDKKDKDALVKAFAGNIGGLKLVVDSKAGSAVTITNRLNKTNASVVTLTDDQKNMTYRDWEKKDPKGLKTLTASDPDYVNGLYLLEYDMDMPKATA